QPSIISAEGVEKARTRSNAFREYGPPATLWPSSTTATRLGRSRMRGPGFRPWSNFVQRRPHMCTRTRPAWKTCQRERQRSLRRIRDRRERVLLARLLPEVEKHLAGAGSCEHTKKRIRRGLL